MELYKVMIIDDEEEVREAIKRTLPWEELGFLVTDTAENGEEALEKADLMSPDVVLTDIQMPFMDGLTFCHHLKEKISNVKIVIFSGYDEFEYAKEAIKLEVEEYLLKPVDKEELKRVFLRLKQTLDEERDQRRNINRLQKYYSESLPLLKEQFLTGLLFHRLSNTEIEEYHSLYGGMDRDGRYAVMVLNFKEANNESMIDSKLLPLSIKTMAEEDLSRNFQCELVNHLGTVIAVVWMKSEVSMSLLIRSAQRICKEGQRVLGINLCAGVGRTYTGLQKLHYAYEEGKSAAEYSVFLGANQVIYIEDIEKDTIEGDLVDEKLIDGILRAIKVGSKEELQTALVEFIQGISRLSDPMLQMRVSYAEIIVKLIRLCKAYHLPILHNGQFEEEVLKGSDKINTLALMKERLEGYCLNIQEQIRAEQKDSSKVLASKAREYILQNYKDSSCSVEKVCHSIGISAAYFALIFKKEMGTSFVNYLTKVRMEQAEQLLMTTQEKAYIIAGQVGYDEPNYFSYAFKKYYGVSPIRYRAHQSEKNRN